MGDAFDLVLSWAPALVAAAVCVIPAGYFLLLMLLWEVEGLPDRGWYLELVGKGFPITAPIIAAILVGPDGDFLDVIVAVAGVTVGLVVFYVSWEPSLRLGGGRSMVLATAGTLAAMACSVAVMGVLARWLPTVLGPLLAALVVGIPVTIVVARTAIEDRRTRREAAAFLAAPGPPIPAGTYPVEWIRLDQGHSGQVNMTDASITFDPRGWRVEWRGKRWRSQPFRGPVTIAVVGLPPHLGAEVSILSGSGHYDPGPEGSGVGGVVWGRMGQLTWRDKRITVVLEAAREGGSLTGPSSSKPRDGN